MPDAGAKPAEDEGTGIAAPLLDGTALAPPDAEEDELAARTAAADANDAKGDEGA